MGRRTDLAKESWELWRESAKETTRLEGVRAREERIGGISVTRVEILDETGAKSLEKPVGTYITLEIAPQHCRQYQDFAAAAELLAKELSRLMELAENQSVLVVGLGNEQVTPDTVGPRVLKQLMVTRHLLERSVAGCRAVSALAPGVLGTTGLESVEIVRGVVERTKPACVLAVDALAARSAQALCQTVQLSDAGIVPGSGIGNSRNAFSRETLGVPVYALGVPTVVDAATMAEDLLHQAGWRQEAKGTPPAEGQLVVTLSDIDQKIARISKVLAYGINLAFHKGISLEDVAYFVE